MKEFLHENWIYVVAPVVIVLVFFVVRLVQATTSEPQGIYVIF